MTQYVKEKVATIERPTTAWALCAVIFALICVYAYFVQLSIENAVAAKDMQSQISALSSSVSSLESSYIAAKSAISEGDIAVLGLVDAPAGTVYIAKASGRSLSFNR